MTEVILTNAVLRSIYPYIGRTANGRATVDGYSGMDLLLLNGDAQSYPYATNYAVNIPRAVFDALP